MKAVIIESRMVTYVCSASAHESVGRKMYLRLACPAVICQIYVFVL